MSDTQLQAGAASGADNSAASSAPVAADPFAALGATPAPAPTPKTQAAPTVGSIAGAATHIYDPTTKSIQPLNQTANDPFAALGATPAPAPTKAATASPAPPATGFVAGVKRNTVDALTALYHGFNDPATDEEKADMLQKIRDENTKSGTGEGNQIPESFATNPSRATLALHRIVDAPADVLAKKGRDEVGVAKDLMNHHEYWKGGNLYLSGLADRALSAVPVLGPVVGSIASRGEGALIPAIDKQGNRIAASDVPADRKDFSGAATDVAGLVALEHAPAIAKATGGAVGKAAEVAGNIPGKVADTANSTAEAIKPAWLTKRPETPAPQHGSPLRIESPLDGPTVGKSLGGKDLSQEALDTLNQHVGENIPIGSTAKNVLTKAVEPVSKTINETASKMNTLVQNAPKFTTSVMQDNIFGDATFNGEIESLKKNLPPSVRDNLARDVDAVMEDANTALNSSDPSEVLEYRRQLGKKIDWDRIEKNPTTPAEVQNAARAKIYSAIGEKIHDIPGTVELDKTLQPNLELRSHMRSKLGDRVVDDPHAATVEAQSEFKKGKSAVDNDLHNEQVGKNWQRIKAALIGLGITGGIHEIEKFFE